MKTIEEIYQELLTAFAARSGFVPEESCDLSVRLYAAAAQMQALSAQGEWVLNQSFPQTARGVFLDRHAAMRGISRTAATKATGTLRFSVGTAATGALSIAAGT
ncbi:MAG: baseplate J/gp47 family protein, partial [Oscillibacter sp.]